ncbi:MAG: glycine cleavage system protein T [Chloroflexi bacterium]|nr:glycine cleavage system protein T [Chloroflexota bacterium]
MSGVLVNNSLVEIIHAAHTHAIWADLSDLGRVICTDRDRLDLIHRLSTNDTLKLQVGEGCSTVFTTAIGRLVDWVVVLNRGEQALMITSRGKTDQIRGWLQRNVFFNDRFQSKNVGQELGQIGIFGAYSAELVSHWWAGAETLPRYHFLEASLDEQKPADKTLLVRVPGLAGDGFWVIGTPGTLESFKLQLAEHQVIEANAEAIEALRIEAGLPESGHELTDDYIPLELGLWDAVSFHKGCYIGQEIIARMESRGKLAKMLVKVEIEAPVPVGSILNDPAGKNAGTLTSVASMPSINGQTKQIGLAVVKSAHASPDTSLNITLENGTNVAVKILELAGVYSPVH